MSSNCHDADATALAPRHSARRALVLFLLATGLAFTAAPTAANPSPKLREGEKVLVTGVVSDQQGRPIRGLEVALKAYRRSFDFKSLRKFKRIGKVNRGETELISPTSDKGEYRIEWPWYEFYNRFELELRIPSKLEDGTAPTAAGSLERVDLTRRMRSGGPVIAALTVANGQAVRNLLSFLATVDSQDEIRVYQEMGKPDKVHRVEFPAHEEVAWWYFERGKTYRFRSGTIESIDSFEPIVSF